MLRARAVRVVLSAVLVVAAGVLGLTGPTSSATAASARPHGVVGTTNLGSNVYLFTPDMAQSDIQTTVDQIAAQQVTNQFGDQRVALMFAPGTYGSTADPLIFQVGYYTDVMGLGQSPDDVTINGSIDVYNQCETPTNCIALNNFWRSLSNLTINPAGQSGCRADTEFWAVSQAASLRRVQVDGRTSLMDYCTAGPQYASGGFIADSAFSDTVVNGSQQQFMVRNSSLHGWSNGVWNQVFVGTEGAPAEVFASGSSNRYSKVVHTPVEKEKPYLFLDEGALRVFVPSTDKRTVGTSWGTADTAGDSLPISSFYVATPKSSVSAINAALKQGRNLLLTPGIYKLSSAIRVTEPDTVVLGIGLPTLRPTSDNAVLQVGGVPGVDVSDLIVDAGAKRSRALVQMFPSVYSDSSDPSAIHDVYLRVGGAQAGSTSTALSVRTSNVVLDNVWSWRADHGTGVGWTQNHGLIGLKVNGDDVTAYGLFVEHFQGDEIIWKGERGRIYMLQNEMPYDPPSQAEWSTSADFPGHAALVVGSEARDFLGIGLGSYSNFNQGVDIHAKQAFTLPPGINAHVHDVLTVFLDGSGAIDSVVNGTGAPVNSSNQGNPSTVVDY